MKIKLIALLLACLFVIPMVVSCGIDGNRETVAPQDTQDADQETQEKVWYVPANAPTDKKYQDYEFTILTFTGDQTVYWHDTDFTAESINGDVMNDAVYKRNAYVEEQLGITLCVEHNNGTNNGNMLMNSVSAGDDEYQASNISTLGMFTLATGEYLVEFNSMGTMQLDAEWWDQNSLKDLSVMHQNYGIYGDIGVMYKRTLSCIMFNKSILEDRIDYSLYDLQAAKKWTVEAMTDIVSEIHVDVNGDGKMVDADDLFGLGYQGDMFPIALIACGVHFAEKDENDVPSLSLKSEKTIEAIELLSYLMYDTETARSNSAIDPKTTIGHHAMFRENHSAFDATEIHACIDARMMENDFGVLCMPLFDEFQDQYISCINPHVSATLIVPSTITDSTFVGTVLDFLAANGKNFMTSAFYDITLQGKSVRDTESQATIDIISNNVRYDLGYLAEWGISAVVRKLANDRSTDFNSMWATNESTFQQAMEKTLDAFEYLAS